MINGRMLAVVVPAYREERLIGATLDGIPPEVDVVVVIDDASPDRTAAMVAARRERRVTLLRRSQNGGVGRAIADGYGWFLDHVADDAGRAICVVMAGDAQMDPGDLPALLKPLLSEGAGYAKGNRLASPGVRQVMPRTRFMGNLVFTMLTKVASGYWYVVDSQCGYTAITAESLRRLDLARVYPRYGFPNDLLIKLNVARVKVADVPVRPIYGTEESGIRPSRVLPRITWLLLRGFWWRLWQRHVVADFHPLVLLYGYGSLATFFGLGLGGWLVAMRWVYGVVPTAPTAILTALLVLSGFQSVLFAMMFDMMQNQSLHIRNSDPC